MKPFPDFYTGDVLLRHLTLVQMMNVLFEESGLDNPDGNQPGFTLELGGRRKWFTRNLLQCYLLELELLLKQREQSSVTPAFVVEVNGKKKISLAAAAGAGGAVHTVDGAGYCPEDAVGEEGGAP